MKKLLITFLVCLATQAVAQECLPTKLSVVFTGTDFYTQVVPNVGQVYSWKCPSNKRSAVAVLSTAQLVPTCSGISMSILRRVESSALITVKNAIRACNVAAAPTITDRENIHALLSIGFLPIEDQETVAKEVFNF